MNLVKLEGLLERLEAEKKYVFSIAFISIFFSLCIFSYWYDRQTLALDSIKKGIVGIASLDMVNINARISLFYKSIIIIGLLLLLFIFLFIKIRKEKIVSRHSLLLINKLGLVGIIAFISRLFLSENYGVLKFIFLNILLIIAYDIYRKISNDRNFLTRYNWVYISLVSFSITCFFSKILSLISQTTKFPFLLGYILVIGILIFSFLRARISCKVFNKIVYYTSFIFLIPIINILSIEIYFILNQREIFISPLIVFFLSLVFPILLLLYRVLKKGRNKIAVAGLQLDYFGIPMVLIAMALYVVYKPTIEQPDELFELANPANAMMRLFVFNEVPLLEAFSSHLLSEQYYGFLYFILNGYTNTTDFLIYKFLNYIISFVIIYYFLLRLTKSSYLVLVIILFYPLLPIILPEGYAIALVNIFLIYNLFKKYSFNTLLLLYVFNVALVFWRMDLGMANAIGTIILLSIHLIINYSKQLIKNYLLGIIYIMGGLIALISFLSIVFKFPIISNLKQIWEYLGAAQAHGWSHLTYNFDKYYYVHQYIFPVVSLVMLFYCLVRFLMELKNGKYLFEVITISFLLIFYFANFQRGLVRHSFVENSDSFLSTFVFFTIPLFLSFFLFKKNRYKFYILLIFSTILISAFKLPRSVNSGLLYQFLESYKEPIFLTNSEVRINRTIPNKEFQDKTYGALRKFADSNFDPQSTFIDFSNTPMLYFYLERRVPSVFNQYMQNTVTDYIQEQNIKSFEKYNLPFVVYSHVPEEWWDHTDDVPNPLRYYLISNYIYNNYKPFTVLNNRYIWIKKGIDIKGSYPIVEPSLIEKTYDYELKFFPKLLGNTPGIMEKLVFESKAKRNGNSLTIDSSITRSNGNLLNLVIDNNGEQEKATISYFEKEKLLGTFSFFVVNGENQVYLVPVSTQYNWHRYNPDKITVSFGSDKLVVKNMELKIGLF